MWYYFWKFFIYHKLVRLSQPTHLLPQTSSCIDLIFTDQPNLMVERGVHPSLYSNCHHQITYCQYNLISVLNIHLHLSVWFGATIEQMLKVLKNPLILVNWKVMFNNKSFHKQVSIFNETLMNIFLNFTPNKLVTFDDLLHLMIL